jgi:hypothetical protein
VQAKIETAGAQWSQDNKKVAQSYREIFEETGNLKYTEAAIGEVSKAATATGKDIGLFANFAGVAFDKFGVKAEEVGPALRTIFSLCERGGFNVEEMSSQFAMLGAGAKVAGAHGVEGLSRILGMSQFGKDALGRMRERITAITQLLSELSNPAKAKELGLKLHVNLLDKKGNVKEGALDTVLAKTGGNISKLLPLFSDPVAKLMAEFGKLYQGGFNDSTKKGKGKVQDGLDAFHAGLEKAAKSNIDDATWTAQAADKKKDFEAAMAVTMNELRAAFSKPEMIESLQKLATIAPRLAAGTARMLETIVNHPLLVGAGFIGARTGMAALGGMAGTAASGLTSAAAHSLGAIVAAGLSKTTIQTLQVATGSMGEAIMKEVSVTSRWGNLGKVLGAAGGIAIAAALLFELGKWAIDDIFKKKSGEQSDLAVATARTAKGTSKDQQRESIQKLKARLSEQQGGRTDAWAFEEHKFERPEIREEKKALKALEDSLSGKTAEAEASKEVAEKGIMVVDSMERLDVATRAVTTRMNLLLGGGGGGSNGPPPPPSNAPGHG